MSESTHWGKLRREIIERDERTCQQCGDGVALSGSGDRPLGHVHHITERSEGGTDEPENLETLCVECHSAEHPDHGIGAKIPVDESRHDDVNVDAIRKARDELLGDRR